MKRKIPFIVLLILAASAPFAFAFSPKMAPFFPLIPDKLGLVSVFFSVYGLMIASVGVYQYMINSNQFYEPFLFVDKRKRLIEFRASQFPFQTDCTFYVFNNGNIALKRYTANYTILLPKEIEIRAVDGIKNEVGQTIIPTHRPNYEHDDRIQTVGADIPVKVYPKRGRQLFVLNMTFPKPGDYFIRYYFTTDNGFFPKWVRLDRNFEPVSKLGVIKVSVRS